MKRTSSAFTMVELIVVTLFLSIIGVYTWTYLRTTLNTQKKIEEKTSIQQAGLSIMARLQDDISQTFFAESYQKLTFFNGEAKTLTFTSLSHDAPNPDDRECEQSEITYSLDSDPDAKEGSTQMLLRKEVPFLDGEQEKNDEFLPVKVASGIVSLDFAYSDDGTKFVDEWNVTNLDHLNKLPKLIRINLVIRDTEEREENFETLIDLPLSEDLNVQGATKKTGTGTGSKSTTGSSSSSTTPSTTTQPTNSRGGTNGTPP